MSPQLKYYYRNKEKRLEYTKQYKKNNRKKVNSINNRSYHRCKVLKGRKASKPMEKTFDELIDDAMSLKTKYITLKEYVK